MKKPTCMLIGDYQQPEFAEAHAWLRAQTNLTMGPDLTAAAEADVSFVVVAQSRPGQFAESALRAVQRRLPKRRVIALLGCWCEGVSAFAPRKPVPSRSENRNWPEIPRVFWHEARTRLPDEFAATPLSFPVAKPGQLLAVYAANWPAFDALADACQTLGYAVVWANRLRPASLRGVTAVLWDGDARGAAELESVAAAWSPTPLVALIPFVRVDELYRGRVAGVVAKPWQLERLGEELRRVLTDKGR